MVYDPESATDNSKVNKVFIDNQKYEMDRIYQTNYVKGTGEMELGRMWVNHIGNGAAALIDDLKMCNRMSN